MRRAVLRRLEELALPAAPATTLPLSLPDPTGVTATVLAAAGEAEWQVNRRFRNLWDAVDWLHAHEPVIAKDLDRPRR